MDEKLIDRAVAEIRRLTRIEEPIARIAATITVMVAEPPPFMMVPDDLLPEEIERIADALSRGCSPIVFVPAPKPEPKPHMDRFWKQMADLWSTASNTWRNLAERYKRRLDEIEAALPEGPIYWSDEEKDRLETVFALESSLTTNRDRVKRVADEAAKILRERVGQ